MDRAYTGRLASVRNEFEAAREAPAFVTTHWHSQQVQTVLASSGAKAFAVAAANLEGTYIIWMFAEFESVLMEHMASNHPSVVFNTKTAKVVWLLSRTLQREQVTLQEPLRRKFELVRDSRNSVAHSGSSVVPTLTFAEALETLARIVAKLPDPLSA